MKVFVYTLSILITSLLAISCGNTINPDRNIEISRQAIAKGDFKAALSSLDEAKSIMTDTTSSATLLTEVAALYCLIDENLKSESNIDKALECYELAMSINPDSVAHCFNRLSSDEKCFIDLLDKLMTARHDTSEMTEHAESDSTLTNNSDCSNIISDIDIM